MGFWMDAKILSRPANGALSVLMRYTVCVCECVCMCVCVSKNVKEVTNEKPNCNVCRFLASLFLAIQDLCGFWLFPGATTTTNRLQCLFESMALKLHPCFLLFRCCECSTSLSHWYYEKDGRLFCKKDYWVKFGELCHGCNDPIATGLIMVMTSSLLRHTSLGGVYCRR